MSLSIDTVFSVDSKFLANDKIQSKIILLEVKVILVTYNSKKTNERGHFSFNYDLRLKLIRVLN